MVARGSESKDAKSVHFSALIWEGSLRALKAFNFKLYCGLGQATIRLPGRDRDRASSELANQSVSAH